MLDERVPREWRTLPHENRESEPARLTVGRRLREYEHVLQVIQRLAQPREVAPPRGDELIQARELRDAHGGLHVRELQVVPDVRVDVLVVVPVGQVAELPLEALPARVLFPGIAPAIAS